jgi:hypothetical protein
MPPPPKFDSCRYWRDPDVVDWGNHPREADMQYALLIYETAERFANRTLDKGDAYIGAWRAYYEALVEAGVYVVGQPLRGTSTATVVRVQDGRRHVQDGPYADTKEQLGGVVVLELPSLDDALDWAARCPAASYGAVEVRPVALEIHDVVTT